MSRGERCMPRVPQYFLVQGLQPSHSEQASNPKIISANGSRAALSRPSARRENPVRSRIPRPARNPADIQFGRPPSPAADNQDAAAECRLSHPGPKTYRAKWEEKPPQAPSALPESDPGSK